MKSKLEEVIAEIEDSAYSPYRKELLKNLSNAALGYHGHFNYIRQNAPKEKVRSSKSRK